MPRSPRHAVRGDPQAVDGVVRVGADDDRERALARAGRRAALFVEREQQPIEPDPETDPRRRPAAEQLDEAVVPPAAAERLLLALAPRE